MFEVYRLVVPPQYQEVKNRVLRRLTSLHKQMSIPLG